MRPSPSLQLLKSTKVSPDKSGYDIQPAYRAITTQAFIGAGEKEYNAVARLHIHSNPHTTQATTGNILSFSGDTILWMLTQLLLQQKRALPCLTNPYM